MSWKVTISYIKITSPAYVLQKYAANGSYDWSMDPGVPNLYKGRQQNSVVFQLEKMSTWYFYETKT